MFFITAVETEMSNRCVGYVATLEDAIDIVKNNCCDINEAGLYPYVVIENIDTGLYQYDMNPRWFVYNSQLDQYEESERPKFIPSNSVGFGIG